MVENPVEHLIEHCIQFFQEHCYSESRISDYKSFWKNGILRFMSAQQQTMYSKSIGEAFILTCHNDGVVRPYDREKIRSIQILDDMLDTGTIRKIHFIPVVHHLYGEIGKNMEFLISHLQNLRRKKATLYNYRLYLSGFLNYLSDNGIAEVFSITEYHILKYIGSSVLIDKMSMISALRVLFQFWNKQHIVEIDFAPVFSAYKWTRKEKLPSYYTEKEIYQIESSVIRSSNVGKRNYAILLLATRLGLRASDIAGLQFSEIDWGRNLITLTMYKTGKTIELPLLVDVGNAIIDYLRNGRQNSDLKNVFLSCRPPYLAVTNNTVTSAIGRLIPKSGISTDGKHHGPHSLRHSLAGTLLKNGTTLPVISEVLGHKSTQSTMAYLRIDILSLMQCALQVSQVSDNFYNQKGGIFYE